MASLWRRLICLRTSTQGAFSSRWRFCLPYIVIDVTDGYKFDLELHAFSMISDTVNPITVKSGDERYELIRISGKKKERNLNIFKKFFINY